MLISGVNILVFKIKEAAAEKISAAAILPYALYQIYDYIIMSPLSMNMSGLTTRP